MGRSPLLDQPAPPIDLLDIDGRRVRLADLAGRPVIVTFWGSYCIPCREEFPLLVEVQQRPAAADLAILGVVFKDSPEAAREFMARYGATWPTLVDPGQRVAATYGVLVPPMTFYIDRAGLVRALSFGPPPRDVLETYLARIL